MVWLEESLSATLEMDFFLFFLYVCNKCTQV